VSDFSRTVSIQQPDRIFNRRRTKVHVPLHRDQIKRRSNTPLPSWLPFGERSRTLEALSHNSKSQYGAKTSVQL
jgi:hypothetical protein